MCSMSLCNVQIRLTTELLSAPRCAMTLALPPSWLGLGWTLRGQRQLRPSPAQPSPAQPSPAQHGQERERQDFCDAGLTRGQRQHLYTLQHNVTLVIMLCSLSCTFIDIRYFYTCLCAFDFCYVRFSVSIAATRTEHCSFSGFLYILI